jgi:hypothetical protein
VGTPLQLTTAHSINRNRFLRNQKTQPARDDAGGATVPWYV